MLQALNYSVDFPTTGRSFQNQIEFAPGLTAITGRNEAGKTIILEMIGYCLFGKAALRGLASDYRNLTATLSLIIGDKSVIVSRQPKSESLTVGGEVAAVGADAINREVPALLGFGLDVFNIACASQQGDLGALTEMRPTARRQMIDQLIGLDRLEQVEKDCKAEAKTQETVALSLVASQPVPQEPVQPDDYRPTAELEKELARIQTHQSRREELLRIEMPVKPEPPVEPEFTDVAALEAHEEARQAALQRKARLEGQLVGMPEPQFSREDLERAVAYQTYADELHRRGPKPDYTNEQLDHFHDILDAKSRAEDEAVCPKCDHLFHPGLTEVEEKLAAEDCPLDRSDITEQAGRLRQWDTPLKEVETFTIGNLQQEILAHARADDRAAIVAELSGLEPPADRGGELRAARAYERDVAVYRERAAVYDRQLGLFNEGQAELASLPDRSAELGDLHRYLAVARNFEASLENYNREHQRYDELCARAAEARNLADGYNRGSAALKAARVRVKQELAPSLSTAASKLIAAMTAGERRHVDVDHDFNITVDGQPLQTLSGSGKSVVNLALRIGLGQVLTSKVLPIFLGDEIDKDMDEGRAAATHDTFQNLREYLSQIILVTHKSIEADHIIQL